MGNVLGRHLRECRTGKQLREGKAFSLRQLAGRIGVEPSYLSKIERGLEPRPSEETTRALALELGQYPDVLLAMAGKVSTDLQAINRKQPQIFSQLNRTIYQKPSQPIPH